VDPVADARKSPHFATIAPGRRLFCSSSSARLVLNGAVMPRLFDSGSVTFKAAVVGFMVLMLLVPLMMLRGLIQERSALRDQAFDRVAEGWGGPASVGGPILIVPIETGITGRDGNKTVRTDAYLLPARLDVRVRLTTEPEPRYVGIYSVPVYQASIEAKGQFDLQSLASLATGEESRYLWEQARIRVPLSESRSLREVRTARVGDRELALRPGSAGQFRGIEAPIDLTGASENRTLEFVFDAAISGSREFLVLPLGSITSVFMQSDWPHPSFRGGFSPVEREVNTAGFAARWQVLELNRSYGQAWTAGQVDETLVAGSGLGVGLYQSVDVYQRAERAVKYALLFIALTFLTFFAWEQLSAVRLHPLQYLLVGLALSMFYVLLLALSEHIRFALAYVISAVALVILMGVYIAGALGSRRRGLVIAAAMGLVYSLLYALILSEDYALLMGAIALFTALAAVMIATRKIDWYRPGGYSAD
jgi:inner membrane protein